MNEQKTPEANSGAVGGLGALTVSVSVGGLAFSASGARDDVLKLYADFKKMLDASERPKPTPSTPLPNTSPDSIRGATDEQEQRSERAVTDLPLKPYLARLELPANKHRVAA